jgi:hypothetical protein
MAYEESGRETVKGEDVERRDRRTKIERERQRKETKDK